MDTNRHFDMENIADTGEEKHSRRIGDIVYGLIRFLNVLVWGIFVSLLVASVALLSSGAKEGLLATVASVLVLVAYKGISDEITRGDYIS